MAGNAGGAPALLISPQIPAASSRIAQKSISSDSTLNLCWLSRLRLAQNGRVVISAPRVGGDVESDIRYYTRRAAAELQAARRAVTPAARERRMVLAQSYQDKLRALGA